MTTITPPPSDSDVRESVDRVGARLFVRLRKRQRHPRRRRVLLGIGGFTLAAVLVGGGGAVAGVWHLPGQPIDAVTSGWTTIEGTGPTVVDLGTAPAGSTWLSLRFSCQSAGHLELTLGGGTSVGTDCTAAMAADDWSSSGSPTFALEPGDPELTVTADPGMRWSTDYRFLARQWSPWKTNARGQTYGVSNELGDPDLRAVEDLDGNIAYIESKVDREWPSDAPTNGSSQAEYDAYNAKHANDVRSIPAYESDGVTVIGEWVTGTDDAGLKLFDK